jgi:hypothetical protein
MAIFLGVVGSGQGEGAGFTAGCGGRGDNTDRPTEEPTECTRPGLAARLGHPQWWAWRSGGLSPGLVTPPLPVSSANAGTFGVAVWA